MCCLCPRTLYYCHAFYNKHHIWNIFLLKMHLFYWLFVSAHDRLFSWQSGTGDDRKCWVMLNFNKTQLEGSYYDLECVFFIIIPQSCILSESCLLITYYSISHLSYRIHLWGNSSYSLSVFSLQKKLWQLFWRSLSGPTKKKETFHELLKIYFVEKATENCLTIDLYNILSDVQQIYVLISLKQQRINFSCKINLFIQ